MRKNIRRNTIYGWALWKHIEKERIAINTHQMERWHLRDMHQRTKVSYLTRWLASHIATCTRNADVTVCSTWIDHYPQAHSNYQATAGVPASPVSVELADLLLVVKVQNAGTTLSERAVLVQAKCVDDPSCLDRSSAGSSTDDERHLLEACCGPIRVTSGAGLRSATINSLRTDYDLGASPTKLGLKTYARYLLVPRTVFPLKQPYMTLWPSALSTFSGSLDHFSKVMLAMTGLGTPGAFAGEHVNTSAGTTDWDHLVKDLIDYCNRQPPLNRFKAKTGVAFPRHVVCSYDVGTFNTFRVFFSSILRRVFEGSWLERLLLLQMMPDDGAGKMPPPEREDGSQEPPVDGFTLLQVTVNVSGPFNKFG